MTQALSQLSLPADLETFTMVLPAHQRIWNDKARRLSALSSTFPWKEQLPELMRQSPALLNADSQRMLDESLLQFADSACDLVDDLAVNIFIQSVKERNFDEQDVLGFSLGEYLAHLAVHGTLPVSLVVSYLQIPAIGAGLRLSLLSLLKKEHCLVCTFAKNVLDWILNSSEEVCGGDEVRKDYRETVNAWRTAPKANIWDIWGLRSEWFAYPKTSFGESLFAELCKAAPNDLLGLLAKVDLPLTANALFSSTEFLSDPNFLLRVLRTLPPCVDSCPERGTMPEWNFSVLAPSTPPDRQLSRLYARGSLSRGNHASFCYAKLRNTSWAI